MPIFISHKLYLEKFWKELGYNKDNFNDGLSGTFLPDIRYITGHERELTHPIKDFDGQTYNDVFERLLADLRQSIKSPDASAQRLDFFIYGYAFHVVLDLWWKNQIYFPSSFKSIGTVLKFIDEVARFKDSTPNDKQNMIPSYKIYFLKISEETIRKWYKSIEDYMYKKPSSESINTLLLSWGTINEDKVAEIIKEFNKIADNRGINERLDEIFNGFSWDEISKDVITNNQKRAV